MPNEKPPTTKWLPAVSEVSDEPGRRYSARRQTTASNVTNDRPATIR